MKHKWHREIKAWSDGAKIEFYHSSYAKWVDAPDNPDWSASIKYRIKPQPKEPQYLYVYRQGFEYRFSCNKENKMQFSAGFAMCDYYYVGKIKLEVDDV